jgi:signal transduction histidine kinase
MTVKELQHLAAAMAHEVRNPLNSMAIHVELLEGRMRKEGAGPDTLKSLAVLAQEIERVDQVLEQYLTYAGPSEAARAPVTPRVLLLGVVERVRDEAQKRGITVELKNGGGVSEETWAVDGDALTEALVAVAANAIAASSKGAVVAIAARTDEGKDQAEVTILDSAEPIDAVEAGRVFHIGSRRSKGAVGLTVAKQIVKGHGGSITVKAQPKGNLFTIRLPLELEA